VGETVGFGQAANDSTHVLFTDKYGLLEGHMQPGQHGLAQSVWSVSVAHVSPHAVTHLSNTNSPSHDAVFEAPSEEENAKGNPKRNTTAARQARNSVRPRQVLDGRRKDGREVDLDLGKKEADSSTSAREEEEGDDVTSSDSRSSASMDDDGAC